MYTTASQNSGQSTPASPPSGWDPNLNIFISNARITRYDHATLPYWPDFVEFCENINSNWTLNDYLAIIDSTTNASGIGITKLKTTPLSDVVSPQVWSYNADYDTTQASARWTQGNEGFKIFSFYQLTHQQSDWSSLDALKKCAFRMNDFSSAINAERLYTDQNTTIDVNVSNRNLMRYYGTKIKGSGSSSEWVDLFKIGTAQTLKSVQWADANFYTQRAKFRCYNYFKNIATGNPPFNSYYLSDNLEAYYDPAQSETSNKIVLNAAPFAIEQVEVYSETVSNITHKILANIIIVLTINDATERSLLI